MRPAAQIRRRPAENQKTGRTEAGGDTGGDQKPGRAAQNGERRLEAKAHQGVVEKAAGRGEAVQSQNGAHGGELREPAGRNGQGGAQERGAIFNLHETQSSWWRRYRGGIEFGNWQTELRGNFIFNQ